MSDTYKVGRGRAIKTVQARQYVKDQDWSLANWIQGPVKVYRDHFRVGAGEVHATKGSWILQYTNQAGDWQVEVLDPKRFASTARKVEEK
jgi:hypothetical protein